MTQQDHTNPRDGLRRRYGNLAMTCDEGSLSCGNPFSLVDLVPGNRVLDLGSGAGGDVLLSARRVGPTGKAWGLDMTVEMLDRARAGGSERSNQRRVPGGLHRSHTSAGRIGRRCDLQLRHRPVGRQGGSVL